MSLSNIEISRIQEAIHYLINFIDESLDSKHDYTPKIEGVFRLNGLIGTKNTIVDKIKKGQPYQEPMERNLKSDPHHPSHLLKALLQELRENQEALIPESIANNLKQQREEESLNESILKKQLNQLDEKNRYLLAQLIILLNRFLNHIEITKMPSNNLALVFGPNLVCNNDFLQLAKYNDLIQYFIDNPAPFQAILDKTEKPDFSVNASIQEYGPVEIPHSPICSNTLTLAKAVTFSSYAIGGITAGAGIIAASLFLSGVTFGLAPAACLAIAGTLIGVGVVTTAIAGGLTLFGPKPKPEDSWLLEERDFMALT